MKKITFLIVLVIGAIFGSVYEHSQIVNIGRDISQKQKFVEELELRNKILEIKVSKLKSLERIESISKSELGLDKAKEYRVVYARKTFEKDERARHAIAKKGMLTSFLERVVPLAEAKTVVEDDN